MVRTFGTTVLAGVFLVAGLALIASSWAAWPRASSTSPLAALFALVWGSTCVGTAILAWRGSRFAASISLAAIGLLLFPATYLVPGRDIFVPSFVVIVFVAFFGYRHLRRVHEPAA
jgi:hypothetical protein